MNHVSMVDILVLQRVFNRRIPFIRFFIKRELIWVPLLGLAWWALDFRLCSAIRPRSWRAIPSCAGATWRRRARRARALAPKPSTLLNFAEGTQVTACQATRRKIALPPLIAAQGWWRGADHVEHGRKAAQLA
ncbi:MAG: hypothetical protein U0074_12260 [Kouleothrix sp.]